MQTKLDIKLFVVPAVLPQKGSYAGGGRMYTALESPPSSFSQSFNKVRFPVNMGFASASLPYETDQMQSYSNKHRQE